MKKNVLFLLCMVSMLFVNSAGAKVWKIGGDWNYEIEI